MNRMDLQAPLDVAENWHWLTYVVPQSKDPTNSPCFKSAIDRERGTGERSDLKWRGIHKVPYLYSRVDAVDPDRRATITSRAIRNLWTTLFPPTRAQVQIQTYVQGMRDDVKSYNLSPCLWIDTTVIAMVLYPMLISPALTIQISKRDALLCWRHTCLEVLDPRL